MRVERGRRRAGDGGHGGERTDDPARAARAFGSNAFEMTADKALVTDAEVVDSPTAGEIGAQRLEKQRVALLPDGAAGRGQDARAGGIRSCLRELGGRRRAQRDRGRPPWRS